jgi:hypothetical protein
VLLDHLKIRHCVCFTIKIILITLILVISSSVSEILRVGRYIRIYAFRSGENVVNCATLSAFYSEMKEGFYINHICLFVSLCTNS